MAPPMDSISGPSLLAALVPLSRDALAPTAADADAMSALIDRCGGGAPSPPAAQSSALKAAADNAATAAAAAAAAPGPATYLGCGFLPPDSPVSERFDDIDALLAPDLLSAALADAACETDADILEAAIRAASAVCSSGEDICERVSTALPPPPPPPAAAPVALMTTPALTRRAALAPAASAVPSSVVPAAAATSSAAQVAAAPNAVTAAKPTAVETKAMATAKSTPSVVPGTPNAAPTPKAKPAPKAARSTKGVTASKATPTSKAAPTQASALDPAADGGGSSPTTSTGVAADGDAAAMAVVLGGLTEADFLSAPKLKRKKAKFASPKPSRFCHLCSRTPKTVRQVVCANIHEEAYTCRKVVCEKCFTDNEWDWEAASTGPAAATWICTHCRDACPARSQCRTYRRTNERLRVKRLVEKFSTSAGCGTPSGGAGDAPASGTESTNGEEEGGGDAVKSPVAAAAAATTAAATVAAAAPGPAKAPAAAAAGAALAEATASASATAAGKPSGAATAAAAAAAAPASWTPASALVSNDA